MRRLTMIALALAMTLAAAETAQAEAPLFTTVYDDRFVVEDAGLAAACGLSTVHVDGRVHGVFKLYEDGHTQETAVDKIELTGPNGEGPVYLTKALPFESQLISESYDPATGLLTLVFEETSWGNHQQVRIPGVGVLVMDRGLISWTATVIVNPEAGELVSREFTDVTMHGPHPLFDSGLAPTAEQLAVICDALGA